MGRFHEPDEMTSREREHERLQTISMFARAVGLSASALRQYGESGLLTPTSVEERTGYRYYARDQQQRAIWIRRLRDAGLRLESIRAIFESDVAGAEAVLDDWFADAQERSVSIEALVDDLKSSLRAQSVKNPTRRTSVRFDSAVLSSAIRQLGAPAKGEETDFEGVLVEAKSESAAIIATDRFTLLARMHVPAIVDGAPARVRVTSSAAIAWLRNGHHVDLIVEIPDGRDGRERAVDVRLRDAQGQEMALPQPPDRFPDVHQIIGAIRPANGRATFSRDDVARLTVEQDADSVLLTCTKRSASLTINDHVVIGQGSGAAASFELSRSALMRIATTAVGDELICDPGAPGQPLVWRTPSQPDFVALMMPRMA